MGTQRLPRRCTGLFAALVLVGALLVTAVAEPASADTARRASSICEAQELKALAAEDPHLVIEIPEEFDKAFPPLEACRSHEAAWDPAAEGPLQPIPFSHKHHAGDWKIDCQYCHSGTDRSRAAGVPSVEVCMGCHEQFGPEYDTLEGIQILKQYWAEQKSIPWVQIHRMPEHVKFQHQAHVRAGFECQTCHGPVESLDKLYLVPDTKWWQYGLPTQKLEMGWCVLCHRDNGASQDCLTCHY
ncbi:MAG: hypothetical protein CL910_13300 [Deltaproteobacteria bacterium]|nr:hypothetical protein [Deltaproteobacteria bacterium]